MRNLLFLILLFIFISCGSKKNTSNSKNLFAVENVYHSSAKQIAEKYPNAQQQNGNAVFEDGEKEQAYTILYPGTPDEIQIIWKNNNQKAIQELRYSGKGKWKTESGLAIGTTYQQLNKLNEKPVKVYGFGWDFSGAVDWNNGKLQNSNYNVFLGSKANIPNKFYGDQILEATQQELEKLNLTVQSIIYKPE